jgi:hypothetical protein
MRKSALERLSDAIRIFRTMSSIGMTPRSGVWPHFLGNSWSSIWIAVTPACSGRSPIGMAAGAPSVHQIMVETRPGCGDFALVAGASIRTLATRA